MCKRQYIEFCRLSKNAAFNFGVLLRLSKTKEWSDNITSTCQHQTQCEISASMSYLYCLDTDSGQAQCIRK